MSRGPFDIFPLLRPANDLHQHPLWLAQRLRLGRDGNVELVKKTFNHFQELIQQF